MREKTSRNWAWVGVALCALAILWTVPVARSIQGFAFKIAGKNIFSILLLVLTAALIVSVGYILYVRLHIRKPARYLWLIVCAGAYVAVTAAFWRGAVEAAHILEYGVLGGVLFNAWKSSIPGPGVYLASWLSGTLVGTLDEIIQWVVPGRYFDFRDKGINSLGVGIALIAIWKGIEPALDIVGRKNIHAVRCVSALAFVNLIFLGLCLSNTPERTASLAARFPFLAPLEKEEPMHEFILRHRDAEIGVFYSRLTGDWLKKIDVSDAVPLGRILRAGRTRDYREFLENYNPVSSPFLYEMRIHLFRRDRYDAAGSRSGNDPARRKAWFVAAKENLILEKYFGRTLVESGYAWPPEKRATMAASVDLSPAYESPVSKGVLSRVSESVLWMIIGGISIALAVIIRISERKKRR